MRERTYLEDKRDSRYVQVFLKRTLSYRYPAIYLIKQILMREK